jgi:hypothetical protein
MKKIEPAVQTMVFEVPLTGGGTIDQLTIDLSQCASLLNRRFYRQGINWAVSGFKFLTGEYTGLIAVEKLPDTWVMSNSWEKGFRVWQRMNNEALEESESVRPRFLDFKIYADSEHHAAGFGDNLLPGVFNPAFIPATPGEWTASSVKIPYTDNSPGNIADRELIAVGGNYSGTGFSGKNAVSLIEGYANSRGLPAIADPNAPADAADADGISPENWMSAVFNEGTNQDDRVLGDMITENNIAPYPFENDGVNADTMYPNGENQLGGLQFHDLELITGTTVGGTSRLKGGMFPCGLVRLQTVKNEEGSSLATLIVDLVPGNHRGYLCEPMTEM